MKKFDQAAAAYKKSGFIKTSAKEKVTPVKQPQPSSEKKESGYVKAAKFLLLVGPKQAADILKQFSPDEIEKITKEIVNVRRIGKDESGTILKEFSATGAFNNTSQPIIPGIVKGGPEKALEMLEAALGKDKGQALFDKVLPFGGRKPFDFLDDLQPEQILMVMKNEPPYVMSIVLSFLKPELSSQIISRLPEGSRKEIVLRIARQGQIAPGVIERMEGVFKERIRAQGRVVSEEIDGKSVLAGILRHMDISAEENILKGLKTENEALAEEIKDGIYTIDLLLKMSTKDIQLLLRDFDNSELAIIIKGKTPDIRDCILSNLSERRRVMIEEESRHLGEMLRSDVDKATRELIYYLMELEERGDVIIPRGEEEWI
ncbi:MAG: flagellar motor switch protein FliG [Spirochaetales bacterium]|nr:flagellar motor switch protein FliG [Spirochaetales bacterium]